MIERERAAQKRRRKGKKSLPTWTHPAVYGGVRAAAALTQIAGIDDSVRCMRGIGGGFAQLRANRKRLDRARANISWCFPDWPEERVHETAIEAYRHLFTLAVEMPAAPRVIAADGYAAYVEWGNLERRMRIILELQRGTDDDR